MPERSSPDHRREHSAELRDALADLGTGSVSVFGRVARDDDSPESDVDDRLAALRVVNVTSTARAGGPSDGTVVEESVRFG